MYLTLPQCLCLFGRIRSIIGSPREPSLESLPRITLLMKDSKHVWESLDDYRPITLLNTELKVLARVLAIVYSDLIGPEQTYAVKRRSISDNLHLIREVLEGVEDGLEAALINLDQSKAFDRVDHQFLATVLETAGFQLEFRIWISMMYHNPQIMEQVNGRRSRSNVRSDRAAPCLLFSMSSLWSPCSVGLGIRGRIRPSAVSLLLTLLRQGFPRSSMISQCLYLTAWI